MKYRVHKPYSFTYNTTSSGIFGLSYFPYYDWCNIIQQKGHYERKKRLAQNGTGTACELIQVTPIEVGILYMLGQGQTARRVITKNASRPLMTWAISVHPHIATVRPAPLQRTNGISKCIHCRPNLVVSLSSGLSVGVAGVVLVLSGCTDMKVSCLCSQTLIGMSVCG